MSTQGRKDCREGDRRCEPKSLREALYCQVNHSEMTRTEIAEVMGINPATLSKWSDPQGDEHMPEERLLHLLRLTDDSSVYITFQAHHVGLAIFDPKSAKTGQVGRMVSEFGDVLKAIDEAGDDIDAADVERVEVESLELIAAVRVAVETLKRRVTCGPRAVNG